MSAKAAPARERLLEIARDMVRAKGFNATSVDDLCRAAGVTKGAFFIISKPKSSWGLRLPTIGRKPHRCCLPARLITSMKTLSTGLWAMPNVFGQCQCMAGDGGIAGGPDIGHCLIGFLHHGPDKAGELGHFTDKYLPAEFDIAHKPVERVFMLVIRRAGKQHRCGLRPIVATSTPSCSWVLK